MSVIHKLANRAFTILKWQIPVTVIVVRLWSAFAPRPACYYDVKPALHCIWPMHFSDSAYFKQDALLAGLALLGGIIIGRFLSARLKEWGVLSQVFAAVTSVMLMYLAVNYAMDLNPLTVGVHETEASGALVARSVTGIYMSALAVQCFVIIRRGRTAEVDLEWDSDSLNRSA